MALVTDKFRIYAAESFRDTLLTQNKVFMFVGRAKSIKALEHAEKNDKEIFLVAQRCFIIT